jgi:hypothetical protein
MRLFTSCSAKLRIFVGGGWIHNRVDLCSRRIVTMVAPYFAQPLFQGCIWLGTDARVVRVGDLRDNIFHGACWNPLLVSLRIYLVAVRRFNLRGLSHGLLVGTAGWPKHTGVALRGWRSPAATLPCSQSRATSKAYRPALELTPGCLGIDRSPH